MNIAIRYFTRSDNTKKLAYALGKALGVTPEDITAPLPKNTDVLFLGCSYYAFTIDPAVKSFLKEYGDIPRYIICFGTSAMMKSILRPVKRTLKKNKGRLYPRDFHCRGQFKRAHIGRPDQNDCNDLVAFAQNVLKELKQK